METDILNEHLKTDGKYKLVATGGVRPYPRCAYFIHTYECLRTHLYHYHHIGCECTVYDPPRGLYAFTTKTKLFSVILPPIYVYIGFTILRILAGFVRCTHWS